MNTDISPFGWVFLLLIPFAALGMLLVKKPIHAALFFLTVLLLQGALFLELFAEFIGVMQVLVYAGAIVVLFVFVVVLFQDAHEKLHQHIAKSSTILLGTAIILLILSFMPIEWDLNPSISLPPPKSGFGTVESVGRLLYVDFFFPFIAMTLLFLIGAVGALAIGKREDDKREEL